MWARAQGLDLQRCHGAAHAAIGAERAGKDPLQAAVEGARRARREDIDPSMRRLELCNWYVWAIEDRKIEPGLALDVARAAAKSVERGMTRSQAFDVADAYARGERVRIGPPLVNRVLSDPGCFPLAAAIFVFAVAPFSALRGYFLVLAF